MALEEGDGAGWWICKGGLYDSVAEEVVGYGCVERDLKTEE